MAGDPTRSVTYQFTDVTHAWDAESYLQRFAIVQKIRAGDIYQLNLTFKARFRLSGSPLAFYRDMRQRQRVAYAGIVDTGAVTVLGLAGALHRAARPRGDDAADEGHRAARRNPGAGRRDPARARQRREAARREPDDRRPDAQRPRTASPRPAASR